MPCSTSSVFSKRRASLTEGGRAWVVVTCTTRCAVSPSTASCRASSWTTYALGNEWQWRRQNVTRSILSCGKPPSPTSQSGRRSLATAARAGTSSARPCAAKCWASKLISTAAAGTYSSRTTRTKLRSPKAPAATRLPATGCTRRFSILIRRKCRSHLATSSRCVRC